jgi:Ca2+-transporting ATPase
MLTGLSDAEAAKRLVEHGPNALPQTRTRGVVQVILGAVREPMFLLLFAASALYLVLGDLAEGLFMVAGACLAVGLTIVQEARSEKALAALRELAEPTSRVLRGGRAVRIAAHDIVPGDILLVGEGERLPADAGLVSGDVLRVDESALTGEAAPVEKFPAGAGDSALLLAGVMVVQGSGAAEVLRTGAETALGRIGASLAVFTDPPTALQRDARRLVQILSFFALVACVAIALAYGLTRDDWVGGGLAGLTVSISLIPEEFPMVLAVFMALGGWRLARHRVLVRRAAVIEELGRATLLCVDKTGTLTENRMSVARLWVADREFDPDDGAGALPDAAALLDAAALASAAHGVDPMDRAILALRGAADDGARPRRTWPLRPERLAVVQVWADGEGEVAGAKGAPEAILRLCRLPDIQAASLRAVVERMASEGLRVLGAASCRVAGAFPDEPESAEFEFRGLLGFIDPLRPDAAEALRHAKAAGISVAMITGDHPATALAVAREAGIDVEAGALTGGEIAALSAEELQTRVQRVRVFARVAPEQKLQLVRAFQSGGEVVAMTGDGVNDAPALEAAEIGIAMGARGSDVAREAADIVLLDDSFSSIVGGVRLGRRIFANLRKALVFITAVHVPIAGVALLPIVMGLPPILFPMHVVLLELVIDPVCSLVFEAEPSEARAMGRPPRPKTEPLFGRAQLAAALVQGLVVLAVVLGFYVWASADASEPEARGATFACLVAANLFLAFSNAAASGVSLFDRRRIAFWSIALAAACVLTVVLVFPPAAALFDIAMPPFELLLVATVAAAVGGGAWGVGRRLVQPSRRS